MRKEWKINRRNEMKHLAGQYKHKIVLFRELVSNAIEAYDQLWKDVQQGKISAAELPAQKLIEFTIRPVVGNELAQTQGIQCYEIRCRDYATGIQDLDKFEEVLNSEKLKHFGMGRASMFAVTQNFEGPIYYTTNNGDTELVIELDLDGLDIGKAVSSARGELKSRGAQATVTNVVYMPEESKIIEYISNQFSLLMSRDKLVVIKVGGKLVPISKEFDKREFGVFRREELLVDDRGNTGIVITGNIQPAKGGTGELSLYHEHKRIDTKPKAIGLDYQIDKRSWINSDQFQLTPTRDDVKEDEDCAFPTIMKLLWQYLDTREDIKKVDTGDEASKKVDRQSEHSMRDMERMLDALMNDSEFSDRLDIPTETIEVREEYMIEIPTVAAKIRDKEFKEKLIDELITTTKTTTTKTKTELADSITGTQGGEYGKCTDGFPMDGHEGRIIPGDGGGIHSQEQVFEEGEREVIAKPTGHKGTCVKTEPTTTTPTTTKTTTTSSSTTTTTTTTPSGVTKQKVVRIVLKQKPSTIEFVFCELPNRPPVFRHKHRMMLNRTHPVWRASVKTPSSYTQLFTLGIVQFFKDYEEMTAKDLQNAIFALMRKNMETIGLIRAE